MTTKPSQLILYRGWPGTGKYTWSPFVTKVEFRCRQGHLPYQAEVGGANGAPKGKIPYVDLRQLHGEASTTPDFLGDSRFIIQRLQSMGCLPDLNGNLSDEQKLNDHAIRALCEDELYFYHMREKWLENFYVQRDKALWSIPYPMRIVIGYFVHRRIAHTLQGQGTGRFNDEELRALKTEIWEYVDNILAQRLQRVSVSEPAWILGGKDPTEADATLFGFIVSVLVSKSNPESQKLVKSFPNLIDYAGRIHDRFFPDYEKLA
ncbi:hypothetical protein LTR72_003363 [Exophiala xenobiotica]|nr:hypothetical protein LTR72_003363 [Exophiala xenobiotica]KAK5301121.1 hypothetical protein LTR14_001519 [Exophiala xenobiotica]KAK5489448.1 hypothetical protein LTR55_003967 [Exophiala xenobiotica]